MPVPVFISGEILTAANMNAVGLWLIKSQTVTGTPSAVVIPSAFSADFDSYRVVISNLTMSANAYTTNVFVKMHDGTNPVSANYNFGVPRVDLGSGAVSSLFGALQTTGCIIGTGTGDKFSTAFDILNPFNPSHTVFSGLTVSAASNGYSGAGSGMHQSSVGYPAFQVLVSTGTITGGNISVYGYRD
jgi:hypothetical protein